jgi:hypothetical protein
MQMANLDILTNEELIALLSATQGQLVATQGELAATQRELAATQGELAATEGQLTATHELLEDAETAVLLSLEEVWDTDGVNAPLQWFDFKRKKTVKIDCYVATETDARDNVEYRSLPWLSNSASVVSGLSDCDIDIFGIPRTGADQRAHLMPNSKRDAMKWSIAVPWILPDVPDVVRGETQDDFLNRMNRYINGSRKRGSTETKRKTGSGIKHFLSNRIVLRHQGPMYDKNPRILIIPILTADQAKTWNGGDYDAVVLAANHGNVAASEVYDDVRAVPINGILQECLADRDEIDKARELLSCVVQSLSQLRENGGFANSILPAFSLQEVLVPIAKHLNEGFLVRKVAFDNANGHPAPDPMLLALKAADNWTCLHEIPLFLEGRRLLTH